MKYTHLGRSGLEVSRLCLGTMNFGWHASEADSVAIMDWALDMGINFWDTADAYRDGGGEQIIGRWFRQGTDRRAKIVLATKVYIETAEWPNFGKLSALHIRRACEASLRRLQTDYIDLYQFHHIDRATPWEEIWEAMERLVQDGKIIYAGSSNFAGWHIAQANEAARRRHLLGLVSEQSIYNLMERTVELEVLPACQAYGLGVLTWSPLAGGLLAGALEKAGTAGRRGEDSTLLGHSRREQRIEANRAKLQAYERLCEKVGERPTDVALAWLLAQPAVTAPVIGPRIKEQLEGSARALEITMSAETLQELDQLFPGPGGPAPEAYTW
jgi:aryl-alcohol dehydrogenase-like predicted oxidoreductase